ncbi:hypothetical protein C8R43DRAFT_1183282 [Mycena crocata]|nr:hypothetical protein C8R43DRAFT_1183282 [Mycena crocata]
MWNTAGLYYSAPDPLKIDISYTTAPSWVEHPSEHNDQQWPHMLFWPLASLALNETQKPEQEPEKSPTHQVALPPDEHTFCIDMLYYVGAQQTFEFTQDLSPAWRFVGQHIHWNSKIQKIAESYVRSTLGISQRASVPSYIAIHARRDDFEIWCNGVRKKIAMSRFLPSRGGWMKSRPKSWRRKEFSVHIEHVIITGDEKDPAWWDSVNELGWRRPDHSKAVENYGSWYGIDLVILSDFR